MTISVAEFKVSRATGVTVTEDTLSVELNDGRTLSVALAWYLRLLHGAVAGRQRRRLMGNGERIHWPDLEEDISVEGLLAGRPSSESAASLRGWLTARSE